MNLNNCLESLAYILRSQILGLVAIHPCNTSLSLQGESHASCLPSTEPMSCTLTFMCLFGRMRGEISGDEGR